MDTSVHISLDKLIVERGNKAMSHKLLAIHDDIERAIAAGITYDQIVATLKEQGIGEINVKTFRVALYRIRLRKKKQVLPKQMVWPETSGHHSNPYLLLDYLRNQILTKIHHLLLQTMLKMARK